MAPVAGAAPRLNQLRSEVGRDLHVAELLQQGQLVVVQVRPDDLAVRVVFPHLAVLRRRLVPRGGERTEWAVVTAHTGERQDGGRTAVDVARAGDPGVRKRGSPLPLHLKALLTSLDRDAAGVVDELAVVGQVGGDSVPIA